MLKPKKDVRYFHFGSVSEIVTAAERAPHVGNNGALHAAIREGRAGNSGARWYGVEGGVAAVRRIVAEGWAEGADEVERLYTATAKRLPNAIDVRRRRLRGDMGDSLDIHAVYRGDISRAWERTTRQLRHGTSLVRIVADICNNGHVSAQELKVRGFAALALSRILNKAGYSTEIIAAIGGSGESRKRPQLRCMTSVTVKPRHVVQDTRMLAATVGMAGFFRLFGFMAIIHRCDVHGEECAAGLGQAEPVENLVEPDLRVMQTVTPALRTMEQAEKWIVETVKIFQSSTMSAEQQARR